MSCFSAGAGAPPPPNDRGDGSENEKQSPVPPAQLLDIFEELCSLYRLDKTRDVLKSERAKNGWGRGARDNQPERLTTILPKLLDLCLTASDRSQWLRSHPIDLQMFIGLENNKKAHVELSGCAPLFSRQPMDHARANLSDLRRAFGYSDSQFDDDTAALQSTLRANSSHYPAQSAGIDDPRARLECRITPDKPKYYQMVPDLISHEVALQCKDDCSIEKTFDIDHRGGFTVYKVAFTGSWTLLHALVAALTMQHHTHEFSVLDLYYHYKKAVKYASINQVHKDSWIAPAKPERYNCMFDWDIAAQALDYYMAALGFGLHTFVMVHPLCDKKAPLSRVFTIPCDIESREVSRMQRVWLMCTENEKTRGPQFNVVMKCNTKLSPRFVDAINKLESQQRWEYVSEIRQLEADLKDRNVSMTSLALEETRDLFHQTAASRNEHMSQPGFGNNNVKPSRLSQIPNDRNREPRPSTPPSSDSTSDSNCEETRDKQELMQSAPTRDALSDPERGQSWRKRKLKPSAPTRFFSSDTECGEPPHKRSKLLFSTPESDDSGSVGDTGIALTSSEEPESLLAFDYRSSESPEGLKGIGFVVTNVEISGPDDETDGDEMEKKKRAISESSNEEDGGHEIQRR